MKTNERKKKQRNNIHFKKGENAVEHDKRNKTIVSIYTKMKIFHSSSGFKIYFC